MARDLATKNSVIGRYDSPLNDEKLTLILPQRGSIRDDAVKNRLGLATDYLDDNPLTSRVTVNRFWQQFFEQTPRTWLTG